MTIAIVASGSRGDVQPYVALAKGLHSAGYPVRVLTSDDFASLVTGAGLEFCSIGTSIEAMLQSDEWRKTTEDGNFIKILARMNAEMKHRAHELVQPMISALEGSQLMIAGMAGITGAFSIAEKLNIPMIQAYVFPLTPTDAFSSPLTPSLPFGNTFNRLSFGVMQQALWQMGRTSDATARRELGMANGSFWGPFGALQRRGVPLMYGYSPQVLPRPQDWDANTHITGYWFLDPPDGWVAPQALTDFLQAGDAPVYIGFGSMGNRNPEQITALTLKALELSGQRGILASGWGGLSATDLPDNVHMLASVPHSWLFPRMAAVVHHGGAGTTAAGLTAGVPSVVIPFFGDQPFWGQRVYQLGVGPKPMARQQLTAEGLAALITQAVTDGAMRGRAAALGERIRAEDGIGQAVALVQQML
ncbi:MAG: glycosyltransferase [Phototrophicaceae bacterium]